MLFDCFTFGSEADPKPFRSSQRKFPEEIEVKFGKTTWKVEHHCNAQKNYGKLPRMYRNQQRMSKSASLRHQKKVQLQKRKRCRIRSSCCFHNSWFSTCKWCCKPLHQADANVEDRDYAGVSQVLKSVSLERFGTESTLDS